MSHQVYSGGSVRTLPHCRDKCGGSFGLGGGLALPGLAFNQRLGFHDSMFVRKGMEGGEEQAIGPSFDGDITERGQSQAMVRLKIVQYSALAAVGQNFVVNVKEDFWRQHFDLE